MIYKTVNGYLLKREADNYSGTYYITHYSAKQAIRMVMNKLSDEALDGFTFTKISSGTKKYNIILNFFKQLFGGRLQ